MNASVSTITSKGQVTIPKNIRDILHLNSGDKVEFICTENDEIIIKPVTKKAADVAGTLSKYKKDKVVSVVDMNRAIKKRVKDKFS